MLTLILAQVLVAMEEGGAVTLDPKTGKILARHEGVDTFGAAYSSDGRAFVTDRERLVEIGGDAVEVGRGAHQPAITREGRIYIPLYGEGAIAVVEKGKVVRRIETGAGTKPHIVSLSPDGRWLWATVQGRDPKMLAIEITADGEKTAREFRYDLVPRVVSAANGGAWFTAHHSTGLHFASLDGTITTPYLDENGPHSEPRKQIEGVSVEGDRVAITHEGRRALVMIEKGRKVAEALLVDSPYWVTLDGDAVYVSIPGRGWVEAYEFSTGKRLWSTEVGGKPKRMAKK